MRVYACVCVFACACAFREATSFGGARMCMYVFRYLWMCLYACCFQARQRIDIPFTNSSRRPVTAAGSAAAKTGAKRAAMASQELFVGQKMRQGCGQTSITRPTIPSGSGRGHTGSIPQTPNQWQHTHPDYMSCSIPAWSQPYGISCNFAVPQLAVCCLRLPGVRTIR